MVDAKPSRVTLSVSGFCTVSNFPNRLHYKCHWQKDKRCELAMCYGQDDTADLGLATRCQHPVLVAAWTRRWTIGPKEHGMSRLDRLAVIVAQLITPLYVLRAPIFATSFFTAVVTVPDLVQEVFRVLAADYRQAWLQIALAFLSLVTFSVLVWYLGRLLTLRWQAEQLSRRSIRGFLLRWLPRLLAAVPLLAAAYGQWRASATLATFEIPPWFEAQMPTALPTFAAARSEYDLARQNLYAGAGLSALLGLLLIVGTSFDGKVASVDKSGTLRGPWLFGWPVRVGVYGVTLILVAGFSTYFLSDPVHYGQIATTLGTLAIFNLFMMCFAFYLCVLTNIYDRTNIPALSLLVIAGAFFTATGVNDNHEIRELKLRFNPLPYSEQAFRGWLASRPDRPFFEARNEPYPIYVVSAEGGGIYAAQHAAILLTRIQDRCPAFAQHIFAISGVSGGSLGSALFSSLVRENNRSVLEPTCAFGEQSVGPLESQADRFLTHDFLSPLAAASFFPDFLQRFLPIAIPQFDRARALEAGIERAWAEVVPEQTDNLFSQSYFDHWTANHFTPALVLNATQVATGQRVLIAPFRIYTQGSTRLPNLNSVTGTDLSLSTAIGISMRFPWLLPAARWHRGSENYQFVDGGYFETSGIDTAHDIVAVIEDYIATEKQFKRPIAVKINLIVLATDDAVQDPFNTPRMDSARINSVTKMSDELSSPIVTIFNSGWPHSLVSIKREFQQRCPNCFSDVYDRRNYAGLDGDIRLIRLDFTDFPFALGLNLSPATRKLISVQSGHPEACLAARAGLRDQWPWVAQVVNENNCSICQLMYTLSGRARALQSIAPSGVDALGYPTGRQSLPNWIRLCRADAAAPTVPIDKQSLLGIQP